MEKVRDLDSLYSLSPVAGIEGGGGGYSIANLSYATRVNPHDNLRYSCSSSGSNWVPYATRDPEDDSRNGDYEDDRPPFSFVNKSSSSPPSQPHLVANNTPHNRFQQLRPSKNSVPPRKLVPPNAGFESINPSDIALPPNQFLQERSFRQNHQNHACPGSSTAAAINSSSLEKPFYFENVTNSVSRDDCDQTRNGWGYRFVGLKIRPSKTTASNAFSKSTFSSNVAPITSEPRGSLKRVLSSSQHVLLPATLTLVLVSILVRAEVMANTQFDRNLLFDVGSILHPYHPSYSSSYEPVSVKLSVTIALVIFSQLIFCMLIVTAFFHFKWYKAISIFYLFLLSIIVPTLTHVLLTNILQAIGAEVDLFTVFFMTWNYSVCSLLALFHKHFKQLKQTFIVTISFQVAYVFVKFPPLTIWTLLALTSLWDIFAVLCPFGPLKLVHGFAARNNNEIPNFVFPTMIWSSGKGERSVRRGSPNEDDPYNFKYQAHDPYANSLREFVANDNVGKYANQYAGDQYAGQYQGDQYDCGASSNYCNVHNTSHACDTSTDFLSGNPDAPSNYSRTADFSRVNGNDPISHRQPEYYYPPSSNLVTNERPPLQKPMYRQPVIAGTGLPRTSNYARVGDYAPQDYTRANDFASKKSYLPSNNDRDTSTARPRVSNGDLYNIDLDYYNSNSATGNLYEKYSPPISSLTRPSSPPPPTTSSIVQPNKKIITKHTRPRRTPPQPVVVDKTHLHASHLPRTSHPSRTSHFTRNINLGRSVNVNNNIPAPLPEDNNISSARRLNKNRLAPVRSTLRKTTTTATATTSATLASNKTNTNAIADVNPSSTPNTMTNVTSKNFSLVNTINNNKPHISKSLFNRFNTNPAKRLYHPLNSSLAPASFDDIYDHNKEIQPHITLGLGDITFYGILVAQAASSDLVSSFVCLISVLSGLVIIVYFLDIYQAALPALPISAALGTVSYFMSGLLSDFVNSLILTH